MSGNPKLDAIKVANTRQRILEGCFTLFSERGIESVSMPELARAVGQARSYIYHLFPTKPDLVIAVSAYVWRKYTEQSFERIDAEIRTAGKSAAERYVFWLDCFLDLYREHRDLLRFNQFFNVYVANEKVSDEQMEPYRRVIMDLKNRFLRAYELGKQDGTLRTDIPEQKIFSTTLHLMLAAVTRYAVGLVYKDGDSTPEEELAALREMLMQRYTTEKRASFPSAISENEGIQPLNIEEERK